MQMIPHPNFSSTQKTFGVYIWVETDIWLVKGAIIGKFKDNAKIDEELSDNYQYLSQTRI